MCSIFGSDNKDEFYELAKLNGYRGTHSHSIAYLSKDGELEIVTRGLGPLRPLVLPDNAQLYIGHQQAPTTDSKDHDAIHPAYYDGRYLWHNGIIKDHQIKEWQKDYSSGATWDTLWLVRLIANYGYKFLSEADGSFACLYFNGTLNLFRNENCPMFIRDKAFSSTKFKDSVAIDTGIVYNYKRDKWNKTEHMFKTKETFFWSPE